MSSSIRSAVLALKRSTRAGTHLALLGIVLSAASPAPGRFVCNRGMAEAGPDCPSCHGHAPLTRSSCCTWIEKFAPQASPSSLRLTHEGGVEGLGTQVAFLAMLPSGLAAEAVAFGAAPLDRASPPRNPSGTTFLRL